MAQQTLEKEHLLKIDQKFYKYLPQENDNNVGLQLPSFLDSTAVEIDGELYYRCKVYSKQPELIAQDNAYITGSVWQNFVTARLSISQIQELALQENVRFIEAAIKIAPFNDFARGVTGVAGLQNGILNNTSYDGTDVLVGVIDAGIDWQHGDFIDPLSSTTSRLYSIWDQDVTVISGENTPYTNDANLSCCNFGVEYTNSEINTELSTSNGDIRNAETSNHGTHVAGTAAGNGNALSPAAHIGMAPNAEIVFVNTDFSDASIIDALDYMDQKATDESKPIVVNLSLGSDYNAHDGTSALAQAIDAFSGTGRVVVCAAGNEADDNMHFSGSIPEGGSDDFSFTVSSYTDNAGSSNDYFQLLIYIQRGDSVTCEIEGPNGSVTTNLVNASTGVNTPSDGAVVISNSVDVNNTDRKFDITVYDYVSTNPPAQGTYTITLNNLDASPPYSKTLTYHVWLYNKSTNSFALTSSDNSYIVGSPASAAEAITVGSYVHRWRWQNHSGSNLFYSGTDYSDDISLFSSKGPLRTGAVKPDIAAPGQGVISSFSSFSSASANRQVSGQKHFLNQGTSMSCPVVTGSVALLLEANPSLSASSIKSLITANANSDTHTGSVPNNTWGYGKLNTLAAMAKNVNGSAVHNQELFIDDDWVSTTTVALDGTVRPAFRFTPSNSGRLESVYFHTGTASNSFSGDITFSIYDDNSGEPGSLVGSSFTIDDALIQPFTWFQALNTGQIDLIANNDYYVVIDLNNSGDSWSLLAENNSASSNSLVYALSAWFTQSFDFKLRPVMMQITGVNYLPVQFLNFDAKVSPNNAENVVLTWSTALEENNSHFIVQRLIGNDSENKWENIGLVQGAGNSIKIENYSFNDFLSINGTVYYRLKQVDYNGEYNFSETVAVSLNSLKLSNSFTFWPNPASGNSLHFNVNGDYTFYDQFGKVQLMVHNTNKVDISELSPGVYAVTNDVGHKGKLIIKE